MIDDKEEKEEKEDTECAPFPRLFSSSATRMDICKSCKEEFKFNSNPSRVESSKVAEKEQITPLG